MKVVGSLERVDLLSGVIKVILATCAEALGPGHKASSQPTFLVFLASFPFDVHY